jgi:hypothetical protein
MLPALNEGAAKKRFAKCDASWLQMDLTGRALRVLLALSLHADWRPSGLGRCFPKRDTLALTTRLQISHISEAVKELSNAKLITVVRLGRKNIYYVRPVGDVSPMPPSNAVPFFRHLAELGYYVMFADESFKSMQYAPDSRNLAEEPLLMSILSDYGRGLTKEKLVDAVVANMTTAYSLGKGPAQGDPVALQTPPTNPEKETVPA